MNTIKYFFEIYKINLRMVKENNKSKEALLLLDKIKEENYKIHHLLIKRVYLINSFKHIINL